MDTPRRWLVTRLPFAVFGVPRTVSAQPSGKIYRVGWLAFGAPKTFPHVVNAVRERLREHGYVEGHNLILDIRAAEGRVDRLPRLAAELVATNADVILAGVTQTTDAARRATAILPIVMVGVTNPIDS